MILIHDIHHALPRLLRVWPKNGAYTRVDRRRLHSVAQAACDGTSQHQVQVDPRITKAQLRRAMVRLINGVSYSTPWKYQRFTNPNVDVRKQAVKLRPGSEIAITLNNMVTTAYVNKIRRISFRGKKHYVKAEMTINTEHIPLILERESKCTCVYCGTPSKGDETSCTQCGAPLPSC